MVESAWNDPIEMPPHHIAAGVYSNKVNTLMRRL